MLYRHGTAVVSFFLFLALILQAMTDFEKADVNDMPLETSYTGTI
jgi:hypothetical protein